MGESTDHYVAALHELVKRVLLWSMKLSMYQQTGWPKYKKDVDLHVQPYFTIRHELAVVEGYIVRGTHRLLVPESLQKKLIDLAHESHQGMVCTKQQLRQLYWWPKMDSQAEALMRDCSTCKQNDKSAVTYDAPLKPVELPSVAWEKVSINIVGPFETAPANCRYAITLLDYFTK